MVPPTIVLHGDVRMATSDKVREELAADTAEFESGKSSGRIWVTKKTPAAAPEELVRLDEFYEGLGSDAGRWFCDDDKLSAFSTAERVYFVLSPDDDGDRKEARAFWEFA